MENEEMLEQQMIDDINDNCLDEMVKDTIKKVDSMPFGITDEEIDSQEIIEEINVRDGEENDSTTKNW